MSDTNKDFIRPDIETNEEKPLVSGPIEGYLQSDIKNLNDGKQIRVFLYIILALLPCLLLIPFLMARDFTPVMDMEAYK